METSIKDNAEPPKLILEVLTQHLPHSLPTLRRLQLAKTTSSSHVLSTFDTESPGNDFLVAHLDFSRGPETEMWLYSSLENPTTPGDTAVCEEQVLKLLARVREIEWALETQRTTPGVILIASLHKRVLQLLQRHSLVNRQSAEHFKFIFKVKDLPLGRQLPDRLSWSSVQPSDIPLVLSRTSVPYQESASMTLLPNVSIESNTGIPIAWAFLGPDGSLKSLHCEEEYRGRGLAKAVSLKLFHETVADLAQDDLYHADVAVENLQSQGVCRSLKGEVAWSVYFASISIS